RDRSGVGHRPRLARRGCRGASRRSPAGDGGRRARAPRARGGLRSARADPALLGAPGRDPGALRRPDGGWGAMTIYAAPRLLPCGDRAVSVELGDEISREVNARVLALEYLVRQKALSASPRPCRASARSSSTTTPSSSAT